MVRVMLVAGLAGVLLVLAWRARPRPLEVEPSFEAAVAEARASGRWVVVHVRRDDRPLGARMDRETLSSRALRERGRDGFVHVRVDARSETALADRIAGPGAALATAVVDELAAPVALLPGFAGPDALHAFLDHVRARRGAIESARARLAADPADAAARVDLALELRALGATARAEAEVEQARLDLAATGGTDRRHETEPRALALHAELLALRGQEAAAATLREELASRYPASPFADPGSKKE